MPVLSNPKHERFAQELAKGQTATDAYRVAGYKPNRQHASRLVTNGDIQARVQELMERGAARAEITIERTLREMAKIGFSDIRRLVKWQGSLIQETDADEGDVLVVKNIVTNHVQILDSDKIDDDTAAAISEVSQTKEGALKVKMYDKRAALVDIGRHLGMFKEADVNANVTIVLPSSDADL